MNVHFPPVVSRLIVDYQDEIWVRVPRSLDKVKRVQVGQSHDVLVIYNDRHVYLQGELWDKQEVFDAYNSRKIYREEPVWDEHHIDYMFDHFREYGLSVDEDDFNFWMNDFDDDMRTDHDDDD